MISNLSKYKKELSELTDEGSLILNSLMYRLKLLSKTATTDFKNRFVEAKLDPDSFFETEYQMWYTTSYSVISQVLPSRLSEFQEYYQNTSNYKDYDTNVYSIKDWFKGVRFNKNHADFSDVDELQIVFNRFGLQYQILNAAKARFTSSLFDIKQMVQADLLDSELEQARTLSKNKYFRAAGVICGVILEKHLQEVCTNHEVVITKKYPTIGDFNEALKLNNIIDTIVWREISLLADIRNICGHQKQKEPTQEDIDTIISGTNKLIKTLF